MSNYNSQLQANNTTLDALITRVNVAKDTATSLPDAGSGGSGSASGSIETCTVVLDFGYWYFAYIDDDGIIRTNILSYGSRPVSGTYNVIKGSVLSFYNDGLHYYSPSNALEILSIDNSTNTGYAKILADCTLTYD